MSILAGGAQRERVYSEHEQAGIAKLQLGRTPELWGLHRWFQLLGPPSAGYSLSRSRSFDQAGSATALRTGDKTRAQIVDAAFGERQQPQFAQGVLG
jgi:hypothetical protein